MQDKVMWLSFRIWEEEQEEIGLVEIYVGLVLIVQMIRNTPLLFQFQFKRKNMRDVKLKKKEMKSLEKR